MTGHRCTSWFARSSFITYSGGNLLVPFERHQRSVQHSPLTLCVTFATGPHRDIAASLLERTVLGLTLGALSLPPHSRPLQRRFGEASHGLPLRCEGSQHRGFDWPLVSLCGIPSMWSSQSSSAVMARRVPVPAASRERGGSCDGDQPVKKSFTLRAARVPHRTTATGIATRGWMVSITMTTPVLEGSRCSDRAPSSRT